MCGVCSKITSCIAPSLFIISSVKPTLKGFGMSPVQKTDFSLRHLCKIRFHLKVPCPWFCPLAASTPVGDGRTHSQRLIFHLTDFMLKKLLCKSFDYIAILRFYLAPYLLNTTVITFFSLWKLSPRRNKAEFKPSRLSPMNTAQGNGISRHQT